MASQVRKNKDIDITVITDRKYFAYSPCGIPFVFSGMITSFDTLILRDNKYYSEMNINILNETTVDKIDLDTNEVFLVMRNLNTIS